jgi:hypothetical protein
VLPPSELSEAKHPMARRFLELSWRLARRSPPPLYDASSVCVIRMCTCNLEKLRLCLYTMSEILWWDDLNPTGHKMHFGKYSFI